MLDGGTQNEARVFKGLKFESAVRLFEHREFALIHARGCGELSFVQSDPGDYVIAGRLVPPFLTLPQRYVQVIDCAWRGDFAADFTETAKDDACRTLRLEMFAAEIPCFGLDAFHLRRKGG